AEDLAFSPDRHTIAALSADGMVQLLDVSTGKMISQFYADDGNELYDSITFSPDGKIVAVGSWNGNPYESTISTWLVSTHERFFHPFQYGEGTNVLFSPDGKWFVTTNSYGLLVLDISPTSWQMNACRIANRNFTVEEWKEFMGDEPYQKICGNLPASESE